VGILRTLFPLVFQEFSSRRLPKNRLPGALLSLLSHPLKSLRKNIACPVFFPECLYGIVAFPWKPVDRKYRPADNKLTGVGVFNLRSYLTLL
tara:strand:+ start:96 stop:371 length:276 start_codon:yes stop_codon:yes gene_type:complete